MRIGVVKEIAPGESRVALVPETVAKLVQAKLEVTVESSAGAAAYHGDEEYRAAGASVVDLTEAFGADFVVKVQRPRMNETLGRHEVDLMRPGAAVASFLQPAQDPDLMDRLLKRSLTVFSMDLVPRITRAQKMDALSTVSTVAGYKAALVAAAALPRFFPLLMTAAGTVPPARVLVIGGGVAGLQAIATSRRLGAVVEGFDVRPKVKEEVQSLGATFLTVPAEEPIETAGGYAREVSKSFLERERDVLKEPVKQADVVIAAAMVPGKAAPVLITADMVAAMKPGSVVVDLAAEMGGNCELTRSGEEVVHHGIRIIGALNLASTMPQHASRMYSRNMGALLGHLLKDGQLNLDLEDKITAATCVAHQGKSRLEATAGPVAAVS